MRNPMHNPMSTLVYLSYPCSVSFLYDLSRAITRLISVLLVFTLSTIFAKIALIRQAASRLVVAVVVVIAIDRAIILV